LEGARSTNEVATYVAKDDSCHLYNVRRWKDGTIPSPETVTALLELAYRLHLLRQNDPKLRFFVHCLMSCHRTSVFIALMELMRHGIYYRRYPCDLMRCDLWHILRQIQNSHKKRFPTPGVLNLLFSNSFLERIRSLFS
jgi:hypothetical protein